LKPRAAILSLRGFGVLFFAVARNLVNAIIGFTGLSDDGNENYGFPRVVQYSLCSHERERTAAASCSYSSGYQSLL
jgi:hypothetical protein